MVDELLGRGHSVVGISRSPPEQWPSSDKGTWSSVSVDIHKEHTKLVEIFSSGFDAIVSCYGPNLKVISNIYSEAVEGHGRIKTALLASTHKGPFIIVGRTDFISSEYLNSTKTLDRWRGLNSRVQSPSAYRPGGLCV